MGLSRPPLPKGFTTGKLTVPQVTKQKLTVSLQMTTGDEADTLAFFQATLEKILQTI